MVALWQLKRRRQDFPLSCRLSDSPVVLRVELAERGRELYHDKIHTYHKGPFLGTKFRQGQQLKSKAAGDRDITRISISVSSVRIIRVPNVSMHES